MARTEYKPEVKAAVMAALMAGQSIGTVATEYNIPPATVRSWKSRQKNGESVAIVATEKKEEIGELLLEYIRTNLVTLKIQAEFFGDKTWLVDQDADQLAVLHGVTADKAIRLLEALSAPQEESE